MATRSRDGVGTRGRAVARVAPAAARRAPVGSRTASLAARRATTTTAPSVRSSRGPAGRRPPTPKRAARGLRPLPTRRRVVDGAPIRVRLLVLLVISVLAFGAIGARLLQLQTQDRSRLASLGLGQRVSSVPLVAERGSIFDRNGVDLAVSVPQTTITADPRVIGDAAGYAAELAPIVGVDQAKLEDALSNHSSAFAYVARKVDDATAARVKALALPGISLVAESKRFYPSGALAAPVLGMVGTDNTGLGGLETLYNSTLSGKAGRLEVERDPQGNEIPGGRRKVQPALRGSDLVLTIDRSLQWKAEQVLTSEVTKNDAKGGMAILADAQTGDILAMVTVDGATSTHPAGPASATSLDAPVATIYEPGSTNKVITMAAAIEEGLVTPQTTFDDIGHEVTVGDAVYSDVEDHPTTMSVADILQVSSNVGTIKIASKLKPDVFDRYLRAFGFGTSTTLGFPGESNGILLPLNQYNATSMASIPIGYGVAVTAMQMLDVYMTIANNGMTRAPRLVSATIDAAGKRHDVPLLAPHRVISPSTAQAVTGMLAGVVSGGTGVNAQVKGYQVAGKTGTARKAPYNVTPYKYVSSFAGFAPAQAPRLAAIVVLDEPRGASIYGSDVAAPAFGQIMQEALRTEQVRPTSTTP